MFRFPGIPLLVLVLACPASAAPIGMVSSLNGKAEQRSVGATEWKHLRLMTRLEAGDAIRCEAGGDAVVTLFASAERYAVAGGATATVEAQGLKGAQRMAGLHGAGIQIARAMVGDRPNGFFARPAQAHQRLLPHYPGWMIEGERKFSWTPVPRAASYSFTLFDQHDNVIWSQRGAAPNAEYPADQPYFNLRRPYVWRLVPFGESGKPLPETRWGILTFLTDKDAMQLTTNAKELEDQSKEANGDATTLVLLAELYRSYGVLEKTLEILERPELEKQSGIREAQAEAYRDISLYAQVLRTPAQASGLWRSPASKAR